MRRNKSNPTRDFLKIRSVEVNINLERLPIMKIEAGLLMTTLPLTIEVRDLKGNLHLQTVPEKFVFDGASIPFFLRPLLGKKTERRYMLASCFHDWCYGRVDFSRRYADELFYFLLRECGVSQLKAATFYFGVRTFGIFFNR